MGEVELMIMLTLDVDRGMNHAEAFSQLTCKLVSKNSRQSSFAAQDAQGILMLLETELTSWRQPRKRVLYSPDVRPS